MNKIKSLMLLCLSLNIACVIGFEPLTTISAQESQVRIWVKYAPNILKESTFKKRVLTDLVVAIPEGYYIVPPDKKEP